VEAIVTESEPSDVRLVRLERLIAMNLHDGRYF
jgi:hypothetical protein